MNILSIPKLTITHKQGWLELEKTNSSLTTFFTTFVLPLCALPPLLLYYAGTHYADAFIAGFADKPWGLIALAFYMAEILSYAGMGWFISQVAEVNKIKVSTHDAYFLAGVAPAPLWLSSLALLVPNLAFNVITVLAALVASCSLIYHGVCALSRGCEELQAAGLTQVVMSAGLVAWALLMLIIVAF